MATLKKKIQTEVMKSPSLTPVPNAHGVSKMREEIVIPNYVLFNCVI